MVPRPKALAVPASSQFQLWDAILESAEPQVIYGQTAMNILQIMAVTINNHHNGGTMGLEPVFLNWHLGPLSLIKENSNLNGWKNRHPQKASFSPAGAAVYIRLQ